VAIHVSQNQSNFVTLICLACITYVCYNGHIHTLSVNSKHTAMADQMSKSPSPVAEPSFEYTFPAIKGIQAKQDYFISMCPLRLIPKIFLFNEDELVPELRAQRTLNKSRVPEIARYITDQPDSYVFSAITASIDANVQFDPITDQGEAGRIGLLHIPMSASLIINDGQHRRAAIELALRENPDLADESIAVVFFLDPGLKRCQQMFADLNRHAIRPSTSIGILYDHRDERAEITRRVVAQSPVFSDVVEMEKASLSSRSRRLFTFSAIHTANNALLVDADTADIDNCVMTASEYWAEVSSHLNEWNQVRKGKISAKEVREDSIHSHGVVLHALGKVGCALIVLPSKDWKKKLVGLAEIDWSRANAKVWEGRALVNGRVSKANQNVTLTTNQIKKYVGLALTPEEQMVEDAFGRGEYD
jgi:DNA sulfur modification protein DndB